MAPISTTITETELEHVQPKSMPTRLRSISYQNGDIIQMQTANTTIVQPTIVKPTVPTLQQNTEYSFFHPKIGNGERLKWSNIILITALHIWFIHALFTIDLQIKSIIFATLTGLCAGFGTTGGVHRYWTHKTYKANLPLRIILMLCFMMAGQNTIFDWVRDHRVHHKYSDTDADPHNANHGFFFSHCGWLMQNKHPEVLRKGRQLDMSDVLADPVVHFSQKYFIPLKMLFCFFLPTVITVYWLNESWYTSFIVHCVIRYVFTLNSTWSVNSAAHIWGYKPYNLDIKPSENRLVAFVALGEGWHNYHHMFPWDYKAAELGNYSLNLTTALLDFFARIGWAWDLKQPSKDLVKRVMLKTGNQHHHNEVSEKECVQESISNSVLLLS